MSDNLELEIDRAIAAGRIKSCSKDGKPGFAVVNSKNQTCFTYSPGDPSSKERAHKQAQKELEAILFSQKKIGGSRDSAKMRYLEDLESFVQGEDADA